MPGYKVRPDVDLLDCSKSVLLHHVKAQYNNYIQLCPSCKDKCTQKHEKDMKKCQVNASPGAIYYIFEVSCPNFPEAYSKEQNLRKACNSP